MGMSERTEILIGSEGVERLASSSVIVAGAGAVGGYAIEGLVRAGVGRIRVIDGDVFSDSNLNRQILATIHTVGKYKAEVACERARTINPNIDIEGVIERVDADTVDGLLEGEWDMLVDCIDSVRCKAQLIRKATELNLPVYSSMGAALHTDTTEIRVANLMKTSVCPLAASLRKQLRDADTKDVTCVYSLQKPVVIPKDRDEHGKSILGSLPTVPAVYGMTLANLAIMRLLYGKQC